MGYKYYIIPLFCLASWACRENVQMITAKHYTEPKYEQVQIKATDEIIDFPLENDMYPLVKSIGLFSVGSKEYIAIHDKRAESINIYDFESKSIVKRFFLKSFFGQKYLYKTSVYVKNFDSLFVVNGKGLFLFDSTGHRIRDISFLDAPSHEWAVVGNTYPPVFKDNCLYTGVRPYVNETSLKAIKNWKVLYGFDFQNQKAALHYQLPEKYHKDLYGYYFLNSYYCFNDRGNFVFSFQADPDIYETNLSDRNESHNGKSKFQTVPIDPIDKVNLLNSQKSLANYRSRHSYGAIFFDSNKRRYLRVSQQKVNGSDRIKKQSLIIFDEHCNIIGESQFSNDISLNTLFFTKGGEAYARVNLNDENALHFVRLIYEGKTVTQLSIK